MLSVIFQRKDRIFSNAKHLSDSGQWVNQNRDLSPLKKYLMLFYLVADFKFGKLGKSYCLILVIPANAGIQRNLPIAPGLDSRVPVSDGPGDF